MYIYGIKWTYNIWFLGVETIVPASKEATNQPEIVKPNPSLVVTSIFGIKQNETKSSEASVPIFPLFSQQEKSG